MEQHEHDRSEQQVEYKGEGRDEDKCDEQVVSLHGEVVNAYIARKMSRGWKRFGFVRMSSMGEEERAIKRLHGFSLYGSKILVKLASKVKAERKRFGATS
ncbi:hypothetical protein V6N13_082483 [Hibiscus sabdariffa]